MPAALTSKYLASYFIFYDSIPVTPEGNISSRVTVLYSIAILVSLKVCDGQAKEQVPPAL